MLEICVFVDLILLLCFQVKVIDFSVLGNDDYICRKVNIVDFIGEVIFNFEECFDEQSQFKVIYDD